MKSWRPRVRALTATLTLLSLLTACGGDGAASEQRAFDEDPEAVRLVRSVRESLRQGVRPGVQQVQRLKEIGALYPEDAYVEESLVAVLVPLKDWDGLVAYLQRKESLSEKESLSLTRIYFNQSDYERALATVRPIADGQPSHVEANALAGRANYFLGNNREAERYYDRVWQGILDQGMVVEMANRAMIHFDDGDFASAKALLERAIERAPDSIEAHNALSRVLAAEGDLEGAERHTARVTELQRRLSNDETRAMRRAAQTLALNEAWGRRDFDGCLRLVYDFLPGAEESFREELYRFLARMYEAVERQAEIPAAIEKARQHARKGKSE